MSEDVVEIEELSRSAGLEIIYEVIQRRAKPDPATFIGKGKLGELHEVLAQRNVEAVLINGDLKPNHHYVLENTLKVECIDRVRLVLEVFTLRAEDRESRLQVERARLRYEIPLIREWVHSAKMGEHPGFLGSGEYAVDAYYDFIRKRMGRIDEELRKRGESNERRRSHRRRKGFNLVSLAGYTNAGKSSLMRALTREEVAIEDKMFSTLSTTTKRLDGTELPILITDTIGFLDNLPPYIIEAFKNTVGEIFDADLILLVVDSSDADTEIERKLTTSEKILFPEVELDRIYLILNKIDLLGEGERGALSQGMKERWQGPNQFFVSTTTWEGMEGLIESITLKFTRKIHFELRLPQTGETEAFITWLRPRASIFKLEYANDVRVIAASDQVNMENIRAKARDLKGSITTFKENS